MCENLSKGWQLPVAFYCRSCKWFLHENSSGHSFSMFLWDLGEHIMDRGWIFRKQRSAWIGYITGNHKAKWQNRAKLQNRSRCDLRKVVSGSNIWVVEKMGQPIARAPCNYNHTSEQWMTTLEVEAGCNLTRRKVWVNKLGCQALDITINWC